MDYAVETVEQVRPDIGALLQLHYEELTADKEHVALAPDWGRYLSLEALDKLLAFTVRDEGKLIGYSVWFVDAHIHYKDLLVAANDVIFLHKDYRKGGTGKKLIDHSEHMLKWFGVDKVIWHIKFKQDWSAILLRRGYAKEDFTVGKIL